MIRKKTAAALVSSGAVAAMVAASVIAGAGAATAAGAPIVIAAPLASSGPAGVADHTDCRNGATLAINQINAAGGVKGRPLKLITSDIDLLTPEGTSQAFQNLIAQKPQAILSPFVLIPPPAMDAAAAYGAPYINGNTSIAAIQMAKANPTKYSNYFTDPAETWYGAGLINELNLLKAGGKWKPKNNVVDIVQGEVAYNQEISQATQHAIAQSGGKWKLGKVISIHSGIKDWSPVIQQLQADGAGTIMIDHWIAAELAAFAQQYAPNPVPGALVYLQYGPSQPEFLSIAGAAANGFIWGTVIGDLATTPQAQAFRAAYTKAYVKPGQTMGLVYTGYCYDMVHVLANAWTKADPNNFKAVNAAIRHNPIQGVTGYLNYKTGVTPVYPDNISNPKAGVVHLFFQVQNQQSKIIGPAGFTQSSFIHAPWM